MSRLEMESELRNAIVRGIYNGTVNATSRLVPEGIPGSQADPCGAKCAHDPDKAKALLKDAFPTGPPPSIFIDYDQDTTQEAIAKAMQANLKDVGITADLRPHPYTDYLNFALGGTQELFRLGWGGLTAYPTADAFLTPLFGISIVIFFLLRIAPGADAATLRTVLNVLRERA